MHMESIPFDRHCAALLIACGYACERLPASWEDAGGPESGPRIVGGPECDVWTLDTGVGPLHCITVTDGEVVDVYHEAPMLPGYEGEPHFDEDEPSAADVAYYERSLRPWGL